MPGDRDHTRRRRGRLAAVEQQHAVGRACRGRNDDRRVVPTGDTAEELRDQARVLCPVAGHDDDRVAGSHDHAERTLIKVQIIGRPLPGGYDNPGAERAGQAVDPRVLPVAGHKNVVDKAPCYSDERAERQEAHRAVDYDRAPQWEFPSRMSFPEGPLACKRLACRKCCAHVASPVQTTARDELPTPGCA
ncbi:MAG: hypothetical protein A4E28_01835 [Methanocella sp. PtaU1.Bin125]|nr:MAG: hypothetical protein A4E28_01835 [Methanocella sp. PtaU1.Bin125]